MGLLLRPCPYHGIGDFVLQKILVKTILCWLTLAAVPVLPLASHQHHFEHADSCPCGVCAGQSPADFLPSCTDHGAEEGSFWAGVRHFRQGLFREAASSFRDFLGGLRTDGEESRCPSCREVAANLYGLSLLKAGAVQEASDVFRSFYQQDALDGRGLLNYALAALRSSDYGLAVQLAAEAQSTPRHGADSTDAGWRNRCRYVAALAAFGMGEWSRSETLFQEIDGADGLPHQGLYLQYYLGLAQFRQGRLEAACDRLEGLYRSHQGHPLGQEAARIAVHCALQLYHQKEDGAWWERAARLSRSLVEAAESEQGRQEAVLLAAGVFRDGGRYQEALSLLEPYLGRQDDFSLYCRFLAAEVLTSQGRLREASEEYRRLGEAARQFQAEAVGREGAVHGGSFGLDSRFQGGTASLGDTATYRHGELLYSLGDYHAAAAALAQYRRGYPAGNHADAALYFTGEALWKAGLLDQAILQHEALLQRHPSSSFVFSSMLGLMELHRAKGEYSQAAGYGSQLLERFPQEARAAGVEGRLAELLLLEQGMSGRQADLLSRYRLAGESGTQEGRRLGLELARLYLASPGGEEQAEAVLADVLSALGIAGGKVGLALVESLVPFGEEDVAASGSFLLADVYRRAERYQEAGRLFLQAARFFLKAGREPSEWESAASALYRGAESFDVAGMKSDSQEVARQLSALFPASPWTEAARIFL